MRILKIFLVFLAVVFSGFSKDSQGSKTGVTVPFKFDGVIITNDATETVCTPKGAPYPYIAHARTGWIQGNQTHGGRLITEESTWTIFSCNTDFGKKINTSLVEGVNTVANGDKYFYTCTMLTNIVTMEIVLYLNITGGTGRYEGSAGLITLTGVNTGAGRIPVNGWGSVNFVK